MTRPRRSTLIRQARQAAIAAKRCEISGNKKAPAIAEAYTFAATGERHNAPAANPITPRNGATGNEFTC